MDTKTMDRLKGVASVGVVLLSVLTIYIGILAVNSIKANKYIGRDVAGMNSVSVSGTGEVYASPDLATMDFSVVSEAKVVGDAMNDNTKKMNAIADVIKSLGVADTDLRTSGFNISPKYDYVDQKTGTGVDAGSVYYYPSGTRVLSGYDVTQTLTVKIRQENLSKIGQIIQEATNSGANQVGDLQFTIDKPETLQAEARKQAIDDAKAKAKVLAEQLGVKLGDITGYSEDGYYPAYSMNYESKMAAIDAAESAAPAIQTGQNKIETNVSITYEIQ